MDFLPSSIRFITARACPGSAFSGFRARGILVSNPLHRLFQ